MEITKEIKDKVCDYLFLELHRRKLSQAEFARIISLRHSIKFDKSVLSQIKFEKDRNYSVIKDSSWLILARHYRCLDDKSWETVKTKAYITIQAHLEKCQEYGIWQVLCDRAGIGKSYAAREFERNNNNVMYVDCSEYSTKSDFVKYLAGQFGLSKNGSIDRLWREVTNELLLMYKPLLILDEFGDCADAVISLMKGLYNKANMGNQMELGCYFIGADNLQKRLIEGRRTSKRSYAEFWSRFNDRITKLNYQNQNKLFEQELYKEVEMIVDANLPEDLKDKRAKIIEKSMSTGGVRAIRNEIAIYRMVHQKQQEQQEINRA